MFVAPAAVPRRPALRGSIRFPLTAVAGSAAVGLLSAVALRHDSLPASTVVAGGVGVLATLALALAAYNVAVALGFVLLGVVSVEPAPTDAVFAVVIAVAVLTGRFELRRVPFAVFGLLGIYISMNLISGTQAPDFAAAARFFEITFYLAVLSVWLAQHVRSVGSARSILRAYTVGAVTLAALASIALFVPFPGHDIFTTDGLRAKGLSKDPNVFGPFLVPAALIMIEELLRPRLLRWNALTKWVLLSTLAAGILLSYSRAAWLNFAVGLLVMLVVLLLRRRGGQRVTTLLVTLSSLAVVLVATISLTGSGHFLAERARYQAYDTERFGAQAEGVRLAEQHPIGIGPGQFDVEEPVSAHSIYVRALAEQGWAGFIVVVALLLITLLLASRNAVVGADTWGIGSAALLGAWCGILANSAFVDTMHWRHLWVVAALIWAGAMRGTPSAGHGAAVGR
jgi:O-antigen ligase